MKQKFSNYNDGYLKVYNDKNKKTNFNAKKNILSENDMEFVLKLAYEECNKRLEDLEFAEANGHSLNMKVKTRFHKLINEKQKVVINNMLYNIYNLDFDRQKQEIYLYLEGVRLIA